MIVVRVELHSAITGETTELARMIIHNVGGTAKVGDYECLTYRGRCRDELDRSMANATVTRKGKVEGHRRLDLHVWHLVGKALRSMGYGQ